MKLLKPHKWYGNVMSVDLCLIDFKQFKVSVQEFYNPHWLELMYWKQDKEIGSYILKKWKKIPLNKQAYLVMKLNKLDDERERLKAHLDKIAERGGRLNGK